LSHDRRVVITGVGVVTSIGLDADAYWEASLEGRSGVGPIVAFDTKDFDVRIAAEVKSFDPERYLPHRLVRRADRFAQFALVAAAEAVKRSGIDFNKENPFRCGVVVGSGIGGLNEIEIQHERLLTRGPSKVSPFMIPKLMVNAASAQISIAYHVQGPNFAVATACASGSNAIGDAYRIIRSNGADVMIAGGAEAAITPMAVSGFCAMRALSMRNDDPTRASRPFDRKRDGFVLGEGGGIVILEEYERAVRRNAPIMAEVVGYGMSGDGCHIAAPEPGGRGAYLSMKAALEDAGLAPDSIDYINAHGTGTPLGDTAECKAVRQLFDSHADKLAISSTKSMIGHLLGASGGVECVACVRMLQEQVITATMNYEYPDPECDLDFVPNEARTAKVRYLMSNSFGFGGHNVTLILGRCQR